MKTIVMTLIACAACFSKLAAENLYAPERYQPCEQMSAPCGPCTPCYPCDPCAPVCGTQCGVSVCAIAIGVAAVAAAAGIIIASGDGDLGHPDSGTVH